MADIDISNISLRILKHFDLSTAEKIVFSTKVSYAEISQYSYAQAIIRKCILV